MPGLDINNDGKTMWSTARPTQLGIWWHEQLDGLKLLKTNLISNTTSQTHSTIMTTSMENGSKELITAKPLAHKWQRMRGNSVRQFFFILKFTPGKKPYFKDILRPRIRGGSLNIVVDRI